MEDGNVRKASKAGCTSIANARTISRSVTLCSRKGTQFQISYEEARLSGLLRQAFQDENWDSSDSSSEDNSGSVKQIKNVPLALFAIPEDIFPLIIKFLRHHSDHPLRKIPKQLPTNDLLEIVADPFYVEFVNLPVEVLFKLLHAAVYLRVLPLEDLACAKVACMIKDKTKKELHEQFPLTEPTDEDSLLKDYPWLEEL